MEGEKAVPIRAAVSPGNNPIICAGDGQGTSSAQPGAASFSQSTRKKLDMEKCDHFPGSFMQTTLVTRFPSNPIPSQPVLELQLEQWMWDFILCTVPIWLTDPQVEHQPKPFPPCPIPIWQQLLLAAGAAAQQLWPVPGDSTEN